MDLFLYNRDIRHERVKSESENSYSYANIRSENF